MDSIEQGVKQEIKDRISETDEQIYVVRTDLQSKNMFLSIIVRLTKEL